MGLFVNCGNGGFTSMRNSIYIDKSGLIGLVNRTIETEDRLTCISRPRRFGKSYAARMLNAYYDHSCDSHRLFDDLKIAHDDSYEKHLNRYHVIYVDMTGIYEATNHYENISPYLNEKITRDLLEEYPNLKIQDSLPDTLLNAVNFIGTKFIMIIDEWDAPIRENPNMEKEYLRFLRLLFKNSRLTSDIFAAVYMTGILPIRKDGSQSAISNFNEYTMLDSGEFSEFVGFTEDEVKEICIEYGISFSTMKWWYDGYMLSDVQSVYNPNSVIKAVKNGKFKSYWQKTSAADNLLYFINRDYRELGDSVVNLIAGNEVPVVTSRFENNLEIFKNQNDVLTALIHLGYLSYDEKKETVHIPNEEIRIEFSQSIRNVDNKSTINRLVQCDRLIEDTVSMNATAVAKSIEEIHSTEITPIFYNNEQSLRSVIKLAYFTYKDHYIEFDELPTGNGYADIVYLPKRDSLYPALVIELKWNDSADGAIAQIHDKNYIGKIKEYTGEILLVGVNYDKSNKKHSCKIEKWEK